MPPWAPGPPLGPKSPKIRRGGARQGSLRWFQCAADGTTIALEQPATLCPYFLVWTYATMQCAQ